MLTTSENISKLYIYRFLLSIDFNFTISKALLCTERFIYSTFLNRIVLRNDNETPNLKLVVQYIVYRILKSPLTQISVYEKPDETLLETLLNLVNYCIKLVNFVRYWTSQWKTSLFSYTKSILSLSIMLPLSKNVMSCFR